MPRGNPAIPARIEIAPYCKRHPCRTLEALRTGWTVKELLVAQTELDAAYPYIVPRSHQGAFRVPYLELQGYGPPPPSAQFKFEGSGVVSGDMRIGGGDVYVDMTEDGWAVYGYTKSGWKRVGLPMNDYESENGAAEDSEQDAVIHPFAPLYSLGIVVHDGVFEFRWAAKSCNPGERLSYAVEQASLIRKTLEARFDYEALRNAISQLPPSPKVDTSFVFSQIFQLTPRISSRIPSSALKQSLLRMYPTATQNADHLRKGSH
ncbi:hypothetical protein MKEN_00003200 [Mycena kentingensis (nom. inval.)]|nr:hypothetical protein MKEN_00003200 [Mycena kentingensis (nom. inval.)]